MTHLLDTNVCIELIRKRSPELRARVRSHAADSIGISSITVAELQYGVERSRDPDRNRMALLEFLVPFRLLAFDPSAAHSYGVIRRQLEGMGTPIGALDTLIAAHALSRKLTVVTSNEREFRRVRGLTVENWTR